MEVKVNENNCDSLQVLDVNNIKCLERLTAPLPKTATECAGLISNVHLYGATATMGFSWYKGRVYNHMISIGEEKVAEKCCETFGKSERSLKYCAAVHRFFPNIERLLGVVEYGVTYSDCLTISRLSDVEKCERFLKGIEQGIINPKDIKLEIDKILSKKKKKPITKDVDSVQFFKEVGNTLGSDRDKLHKYFEDLSPHLSLIKDSIKGKKAGARSKTLAGVLETERNLRLLRKSIEAALLEVEETVSEIVEEGHVLC